MVRVKKTSTSQSTSKTFSIPNKIHRQSYNVRVKSALATQKRKERHDRKREEERTPTLKTERLKTNIPATLERKRVWDERVEGTLPEEPEKPDLKKRKTAASGSDSDSDSDSENGTAVSKRRKAKNKEAAAVATKEAPKADPTPDELEAQSLAAHEKAQSLAAETQETASLFPTLQTLSLTTIPRILITTSRGCHTHAPAEELTYLFPNATYIPRGATHGHQFSISEICNFASAPSQKLLDPLTNAPRKPFTHVCVVNSDRKIVNALTIVVLPKGPTFHFSLTNYRSPERIRNHGRPTSHTPELILNNFLTPLGRVTASLFQSMFPPQPEFRGRQVVTLHNQRDYIFFRKHRYVFREKRVGEKNVGYGLEDGGKDGGNGSKGEEGSVKVGLQELGPQFTLKLRRLERGVKEGVEWEWKGRMEKERRKFQM